MPAAHRYCIYLLTNATRRVLYTGITNDLPTRLHQHIRSRGNPPKPSPAATNAIYWCTLNTGPTLPPPSPAKRKSSSGTGPKKMRW